MRSSSRILRALGLAVAASGALSLVGGVPAAAAAPGPSVTTVESLATVSCTAAVTVLQRYEESFTARVTVTNTGTTTVTSWRVTFGEGREQIMSVQNGAGNGTIVPGGSVRVDVFADWPTNGRPRVLRVVCA
jgi:hypothetical protein